MDFGEARKLVVKAGIELVASGLIARTWGNVSCRVDENTFVITPSGRDYLSLTPEEIVPVKIADCSYTGDIKPSSEKGIHAEVYLLRPEVNFVIHTHQNQASVISAAGLNCIKFSHSFPWLGDEILVAPYALPGTKKLRRNVSQVLALTQGQAVIMQNHGALCFGRNYEETFQTAYQLEEACGDYIIGHYLKRSGCNTYDQQELIAWALTGSDHIKNDELAREFQYHGRRTADGFILFDEAGQELSVGGISPSCPLPREAALYQAIFRQYKAINCILYKNSPEIAAISRCGISLKPMLDDFAQIAGIAAQSADCDPVSAAAALKRSSVVFIRNHGALCCGSDPDEAAAVAAVTQKNCQAYIGAALFGRVKPIHSLEALLMRIVYQMSYSRQK